MDDTAGVRFRARGVRLTKSFRARTLKLVGELRWLYTPPVVRLSSREEKG
jgi:hypothetical protein